MAQAADAAMAAELREELSRMAAAANGAAAASGAVGVGVDRDSGRVLPLTARELLVRTLGVLAAGGLALLCHGGIDALIGACAVGSPAAARAARVAERLAATAYAAARLLIEPDGEHVSRRPAERSRRAARDCGPRALHAPQLAAVIALLGVPLLMRLVEASNLSLIHI